MNFKIFIQRDIFVGIRFKEKGLIKLKLEINNKQLVLTNFRSSDLMGFYKMFY